MADGQLSAQHRAQGRVLALEPRGGVERSAGRGYFIGNATPGRSRSPLVRHSLPHRGFTRNEGTENEGFSRLNDGGSGDLLEEQPLPRARRTPATPSTKTRWPRDCRRFRGGAAHHTVRIAWGAPFARKYEVQTWDGEDPMRRAGKGRWTPLPTGAVTGGKGGLATVKLAAPVNARFVRVAMRESSGTCDSHGAGDRRNCVGLRRQRDLRRPHLGGHFTDSAQHAPDPAQTATFCSSVDPWHEPGRLDHGRRSVGTRFFFTSGVTRGLPTMIPVSLAYGAPEDSPPAGRSAEARLPHLARRAGRGARRPVHDPRALRRAVSPVGDGAAKLDPSSSSAGPPSRATTRIRRPGPTRGRRPRGFGVSRLPSWRTGASRTSTSSRSSTTRTTRCK